MATLRPKDAALFCFATRGFNFATRKSYLDTPVHARNCVAVATPLTADDKGSLILLSINVEV